MKKQSKTYEEVEDIKDESVENWQQDYNPEIHIVSEKWQVWKAKTQIAFNGKLWCGNPKDYITNYSTLTFYIFCCCYWFQIIGTIYDQDFGMWYVQYSLLFVCVPAGVYFVLCFYTEPGVIPRGNLQQSQIKVTIPTQTEGPGSSNSTRPTNAPEDLQQSSRIKDFQRDRTAELATFGDVPPTQIGDASDDDEESEENSIGKRNSGAVDEEQEEDIDQEEQVNSALINEDKETGKLSVQKKQTNISSKETNKQIQGKPNTVNHRKIMKITSANSDEDPNIKYKVDIGLYRERYCTTCQIMRPPKASHCSRCDQCVKEYDHHCFFIANCVGSRNIKYFCSMLLFMTLTLFYSNLLAGIAVYNQLDADPLKQMKDTGNVYTCFLVFLGFTLWSIIFGCNRCIRSLTFTGLFVTLGLIIYHTYEANKGFYLSIGKPMMFLFLTLPMLQMVLPMAVDYTFNVSRGITEKEKKHIRSAVGYGFEGFKLNRAQKLQNVLRFFKSDIPRSLLFDQ